MGTMNETDEDKYNLKLILERNNVYTEELLLELEDQVDLILKVDLQIKGGDKPTQSSVKSTPVKIKDITNRRTTRRTSISHKQHLSASSKILSKEIEKLIV